MDQASLRAELQTLHRESFGWAMSCCRRDAFMAEEVLQRTYLKVLARKAVYRGSGSFRTWLFAVIRRTAQDERRRRWLGQLRFLKYAGLTQNRLLREERIEPGTDGGGLELVEMLAGLSDRQVQILQLVFYHEMSLSEAADAMGVSIGSARTHYDRAKKAIRAQLDEKGANGPQAATHSLAGVIL